MVTARLIEQLIAEEVRDAQSWGAQLRQLRINAGLTQLELSAQVGVTPSMIAHLENGNTNPTQETLDILRVALPDLPSTMTGRAIRLARGAIDPAFGIAFKSSLKTNDLTTAECDALLELPKGTSSSVITGHRRPNEEIYRKIVDMFPELKDVPVEIADPYDRKSSRATTR